MPVETIMTPTSPKWTTELLSLLLDGSSEEMCRRALDLKTEHTPASLYRYRKPTSLDEIRSNTIWLSAPSKFNDPFDSAVSIDLAPAMQASLAGADARSKFASADPARLAAFVQAEDKLASLDELFAAAAAGLATTTQGRLIYRGV